MYNQLNVLQSNDNIVDIWVRCQGPFRGTSLAILERIPPKAAVPVGSIRAQPVCAARWPHVARAS